MATTTTTTHANHLVQTWSPILHLAANEERVVTRMFATGDDVQVQRFGNKMNISKVAAIPASTLAGTSNADSLTGTTNTEATASVSPTFAYGFVPLGLPQLLRCMDDKNGAKYKRAYRQQIAAGIATKIDVDGATLAASLTTNQVGGSGQHLSQDLILDAIQMLIISGKDHTRVNRVGGKTPKYLCVHPTEYKYLMKISQLTQADIRGDADNPTVSGMVWEGYGLTIDESGNIYNDGSVYHNMLYTQMSHVLGYNLGPDPMMVEQPLHAAYNIFGFIEYGVGEIWDEYAADIMTG